jgi:hypothetical protein
MAGLPGSAVHFYGLITNLFTVLPLFLLICPVNFIIDALDYVLVHVHNPMSVIKQE